MGEKNERTLERVHCIPGRLRLRLPWLADFPAEAEPLADHLAALAGVERVEIRARTGSVLCHFDEALIDAATVVAAVGDRSGAREGAGESPPRPRRRRPGSLGRALTRSAVEIDGDLLEASGGRVDLGTLAALAFLAIGAVEIVATRKLPVPPWFNLAWWAFRTFTEFEVEDGPAATG